MKTQRTMGKWWINQFWAHYTGWVGSDTKSWVWEGANYLHQVGCTAKAAAKIMSDKQSQSPRFTAFAETSGCTATVSYLVAGKGCETEEDRKVIRMLKNGAHLSATSC